MKYLSKFSVFVAYSLFLSFITLLNSLSLSFFVFLSPQTDTVQSYLQISSPNEHDPLIAVTD